MTKNRTLQKNPVRKLLHQLRNIFNEVNFVDKNKKPVSNTSICVVCDIENFYGSVCFSEKRHTPDVQNPDDKKKTEFPMLSLEGLYPTTSKTSET